MTDNQTKNTSEVSSEIPKPEVLKSQADDDVSSNESVISKDVVSKIKARPRRTTYRPSHRATFIGLAVVVGILVLNAVIITVVINSNDTPKQTTDLGEVTLSATALDKLGVSRNPIGNSIEELVVGPNSRFNGSIKVGSDVSIAGQLTLNSKLSATDASLTNLQAGDTSLAKLNVNGDGTVSNFNLRQNLSVVGTSILQGPVTIGQLLTINNNANIVGNLAVGGLLTARVFEASSLISDTTLTIGGHIITSGVAPSASTGSGVGNNGTVSISGNDASGTVAVNIGTNGGNGILAQINFRNQYGSTPHVIVTAVGRSAGNFYINRNANGFSIVASDTLSPGGYAFDYIVMQ